MTPNRQTRSYTFRSLTAAALLVLVHVSASLAFAADSAVSVAAVQATRVTDLVLLDRGFDAGLRQGMVCRVSRAGADVAEILLVDLRPDCSAALILSLASKQAIRAGDIASIKILKT